MKKKSLKQMALQRSIKLIDLAIHQEEYSRYHIQTAKKIISKYKLKIPYEYKILFCKKCKQFMIPGKDSRVRIGRTNTKAIRITCNTCHHTYRKIIDTHNSNS